MGCDSGVELCSAQVQRYGNQATQGDLSIQMPQVFPGARRMNPCSPQLDPQEFFTLQQALVMPTSRMSWLRLVLQLLKMPDEYLLQLVASQETPTGCDWMALAKASQPMVVFTLLILKEPPLALQVWVLAVQAYSPSEAMPLSFTQAKPWQLNPPLHPSLPYDLEQSTNCCSERLTFCPLKRAHDSRTPVAEKAQQEPQLPWFLMGETFPWVVQSTSALTGTASRLSPSVAGTFLGERQVMTNSISVRPVNWLTPMVQVWDWSRLCCWMASRLRWKMSLRKESSSSVQVYPKRCFHSRYSSLEE